MSEVRTFPLNGQEYTVRQLADMAGIDSATMYTRLKYMSPEVAVSKPLQEPPRYYLDGKEMSLEAIAFDLGTDVRSIRERAHNGHMTMQDAINYLFERSLLKIVRSSKSAKSAEDMPLSDHWCFGCEWARWIGERCSCPFVAGSCIKVPSTINNPNPKLKSGTDFWRAKEEEEIHKRISAIKARLDMEVSDGSSAGENTVQES